MKASKIMCIFSAFLFSYTFPVIHTINNFTQSPIKVESYISRISGRKTRIIEANTSVDFNTRQSRRDISCPITFTFTPLGGIIQDTKTITIPEDKDPCMPYKFTVGVDKHDELFVNMHRK